MYRFAPAIPPRCCGRVTGRSRTWRLPQVTPRLLSRKAGNLRFRFARLLLTGSFAPGLKRPHLFRRKCPGFSNFEAADFDTADPRSNQLEHLGVERLHHPPHLPVASFGEGDLEKGEARRIAHAGYLGGASGTIGELDPIAQ